MANQYQIQKALHSKYNRVLFAKEVLSPIFGNGFTLHANAAEVLEKPNQTESKVIQNVQIYGRIVLDDSTEVNCYEILLRPQVRIEQSKVAIQHYVRKILVSGQAALINFVSTTYDSTWRLTLVAKDSIITENGVKDKTTHAKRFTFLMGPSETCKTAAERFETLSIENRTSIELLVKAFSVEKLSDDFFAEYKYSHYSSFVETILGEKLIKKNSKEDKWIKTGSYSSFFIKAFLEKMPEEEAKKNARNFVKKLLGRIVFLYFVQKKGWLGASNCEYADGDTNFMMNLFLSSGGDESFYPVWLSKLFFDTLNTKHRNDNFELPSSQNVKIPYLNGGLFDREEHDDHTLVFKPTLFHNPENADTPAQRGFLDFLNAFNFTVFEDSPEEHTVAVDPEMLGHIFENLLEDNKDKGAFYTPKEIVHYMCQESLTEYLATHLAKEYTLYKTLNNNQLELFGNEVHTGQISLLEELGDKAINREYVELIVKNKDIEGLSTQQIKRIAELLDAVKICDPAIGSGAFPMGLLQEIIAIKEVIAYKLNIPWHPATVKESIIQNSIYGVDIEKGAVDIARLRFWLSLVVDEDKPKALPNLDYKIVVGNSLVSKFEDEIIEIDWSLAYNPALQQSRPDLFEKFNTTTLKIIEKQKTYFLAEGTEKKEIAKEIRSAKIELLQILFEVKSQKLLEKGIQVEYAKNKKETAIIVERKLQYQHLHKIIKDLSLLKEHPSQIFNHFDWKLDFPEILNPLVVGKNAGFDIVIGNPPWGANFDEHDIKIIKDNHKDIIVRMIDSFMFFIDISFYLTNADGFVSKIIPEVILNQQDNSKLRKKILKETNILKIINLGDGVFEGVTRASCIIILEKKRFQKTNYIINDFEKVKGVVKFLKSNHFVSLDLIRTLPNYIFPSKDIDNYNILTKLDNVIILEKLLDKDGIQRGISPDFKTAFIVNEDIINHYNLEQKFIRKTLTGGKDVGKYIIKTQDKNIIYTDNDTDINKIPNIYSYILQFKDNITCIEVKQGKHHIYALHRAREEKIFTKPSKIIGVITGDKLIVAYDDKQFFPTDGIYLMSTNNKTIDKALTAILNSKISTFLYRLFSNEKGKILAQIKTKTLELIPIPQLKEKPTEILSILVDYLEFLNNQDNVQVIAHTENKRIAAHFEEIINMIVYELYFEQHMTENGIDVLQFIQPKSITNLKNDLEKGEIVKDFYLWYQKPENPVRQRILLVETRSPEILAVINKSIQ